MTQTSPGTVLFDMDGVLIDSHHCAHKILAKVAATYGITLSVADIRAMGSLSGEQFWRTLKQRYGLTPTVDELQASYPVADEIAQYAQLGLMPGIEQQLQQLKNKGYQLGLVTSATRERVDAVLALLTDADVFEVVISAEDVSRHKPEPHGYHLALELMSASSARSVAVEDSANGAMAACLAGCKVIGFKSPQWADDPFAANAFVDDFRHHDLLSTVEVVLRA